MRSDTDDPKMTYAARRALSVVAVLLAALAATSAVARADPADQSVAYQGSPTHAGFTANAGLTAPLAQAWAVTLDGATSYPLIVNGVVYVTTANDTLYALNQATGATLWSRDIAGTYFWSALAYDAGQLFSVNVDGALRAHDPQTGSVRWTKQLGFMDAAPTAVDGTVYVSTNNVLQALRASDGTQRWAESVNGGDQSSP